MEISQLTQVFNLKFLSQVTYYTLTHVMLSLIGTPFHSPRLTGNQRLPHINLFQIFMKYNMPHIMLQERPLMQHKALIPELMQDIPNMWNATVVIDLCI